MNNFKLKPGVIYGNQLKELYSYCKEKQCALPAVNVIGSSSISSALNAAKKAQAPIIIQFSHGGSIFNAGKNLDNTANRAAIIGAVAGAFHVHKVASSYGVSVILHTDHCSRKIIDWVDGLIEENANYYKTFKRPLFSSHMLDLSEDDLNDNINTCKEYLVRMAKYDISLEIELGVTGGEEDGVDNSGLDSSSLYTQPEEVLQAYDALNGIGHFTVAAAFGNTHGVYKPGNVKLTPIILKNSQELIENKRGTATQPLDLVFHGGSGSEKEKITEALQYGVVKMNIDTDTQWAYTKAIRAYFDEKHDYLMAQIGNPEGKDKPNKKYQDPRVWMLKGEDSMTERLVEAFKDLNSFQNFNINN